MEKYSNILKIEEIRRLAGLRQYKKAEKILDTIDVKKIRVITDLSLFVDVYTRNERYAEAMEVLLRIYQKSNNRRVVFQLVNLCIRQGNLEEAEAYYEEYILIAPRDSNRYILRYRIDKAKSADYITLIHTLKELKEADYIEEWAYELAKLYHKAGMKEECIAECSDIILWFGEGITVEKAKMLKGHYLGEDIGINVEPKVNENINQVEESVNVTYVAEEMEENQNQSETIKESTSVEEQSKDEVDWGNLQIDLTGLGIKEPEETVLEEVENVEESMEEPTEESVNTIQDPKVIEEFIVDNRDVKEIFGYLLANDGLKNEIKTVLNHFVMNREMNHNILVVGYEKVGKTTLIKKLAKVLYQVDYLKSSRIALIKADKLNNLDLLEKKEQLRNACVIIEKSSELNDKSIQDIMTVCDEFKDEIVFAFEDNEDGIIKLFEINPRLSTYCDSKITIPKYSKSDLYAFAIDYLKEIEYKLTEDAKIILKDMIAQVVDQVPLQEYITTVREIINEAKEKAEQRNMLFLMDVVNKSNYENTDLSVLEASDFEF